jgi:uncharacterized protein (TIGR00251 family)
LRAEDAVLSVTQRGDAIVFSVRVQPRASRNTIGGEWQGALKVYLTAPPVEDRANESLRRLLAEHLEIPVAAVRILSGGRSRIKRVEVRGTTAQRIRELA